MNHGGEMKLNIGDTVRFSAEVPGWSMADWNMSEGDGFVDWIEGLDGLLGEVVGIEIGDGNEESYVDILFQNGEELDSVWTGHFVPVPGVKIMKRSAA